MNGRPTGKTKDAGWQIGVSRTVPVDVETAWTYLMSPAGITAWLGTGVNQPLTVGSTYCTDEGTTGEIRSVRDCDRVRFTWQPIDRPDPATGQIALTPAAGGCTFRFHSEGLASSEEREAMRSHWKTVADIVESTLTGEEGDGSQPST